MNGNLADARLALHQRVTGALVELFAEGGDITDEDFDTAAEIVDELFERLGLEVMLLDDGRAAFTVQD